MKLLAPLLVTNPARPTSVASAKAVNTSTMAGVNNAYRIISLVSTVVIFFPVFRGAANHQASQENGDQRGHHDIVKPGSQPSEDYLSQKLFTRGASIPSGW